VKILTPLRHFIALGSLRSAKEIGKGVKRGTTCAPPATTHGKYPAATHIETKTTEDLVEIEPPEDILL